MNATDEASLARAAALVYDAARIIGQIMLHAKIACTKLGLSARKCSMPYQVHDLRH
jgi:hypothetical protein